MRNDLWMYHIAGLNKAEDRPLYSKQEIRDYHRKLIATNSERRRQQRREIPHPMLDRLIGYASDSDHEIREKGEEGIKVALTTAGTLPAVLAIVAAAQKLVVLGEALVFASVMSTNIRRNVGMIKSIPNNIKANLARDLWLMARNTGDIDIDDATKLLMDTYNLDEGKAKLIATDQSRKMEASKAEAQQISKGINSYIWETKKDARVRPTHRLRQGRKYRWSDPGIRPGEEIQCRCVALPVIQKK